MTDKYLSYIFFTCYIPLKHKYESYDIKGYLPLSLDFKKNSLNSWYHIIIRKVKWKLYENSRMAGVQCLEKTSHHRVSDTANSNNFHAFSPW